MTKFAVGDKVRLIRDFEIHKKGDVHTVSIVRKAKYTFNQYTGEEEEMDLIYTEEGAGVFSFRLELVPVFKIGDRVRVILEDFGPYNSRIGDKGKEFTITTNEGLWPRNSYNKSEQSWSGYPESSWRWRESEIEHVKVEPVVEQTPLKRTGFIRIWPDRTTGVVGSQFYTTRQAAETISASTRDLKFIVVPVEYDLNRVDAYDDDTI